MRKLALLIAISCMVSVSVSYASDIKIQKKLVSKVENALSQAAASIDVAIKAPDSCVKKKAPLNSCADDAWIVVWSLRDICGFETAYAVGKTVYLNCMYQ